MYGIQGGFLGNTAGMLAGAPSFEINRRPGALGGRSGEQLQRLYKEGTQQNQQLNDELMRRGIMPGAGPQLPLAFGGFSGNIGNVGGLSLAMNTPDPGLVEQKEQEQKAFDSLNQDTGATRFYPSQLNVQPMPGYNTRPGYNPFGVDIERDSFILHNPRSGVAQMPAGFQNKFVS